MARTKSLFPSLPLPRRVLPWVLFGLGAASIAAGAITREFAALGIGVIALGGATLSWAAEWLLSLERPPRDDDAGDGT